MREDLNKVLCEDSRNGGMDFHYYRKDMEEYNDLYEDFEDDEPFKGASSRGRIGIRKIYGWDRREFNEHLNPLKGILRKNTGRKWDKVYSELCQVFDKRSVINQHILLHLDQYVNTKHIVVKNGKLFEQTHYRYYRTNDRDDRGLLPLKESSVEWYVDPRDGILKFNKNQDTIRKRRKARENQRRKEQLDQKRVYDGGKTEIERSKTGQWWLSKYEFYPRIQAWIKDRYYNYVTKEYEVVEKLIWTYPEARDYAGNTVRQQKVQVLYKQMNSQELKYYGVENRPVENETRFSNSKLKRLAKRLQKGQ